MKSIKIFLLSSAFLLSLSSCNEDLLNTVPVTSFSDLTVFDNIDRVEQQATGLYASVKNGNFLGGRNYVYHEIRCENFLNETANNVTGFSVWNHTVQPSNVNDVTNLWNTAYLAINRVNVFLDGMDANTAKLKTQGVSDATLNAYRAEARFLRALSYHSLLQLYASPYNDGNGAKPGLPLQLKGNVAAGENDLARSTVAEVYAVIVDDLNFAEANLPETRAAGTAVVNSTRAVKNAAIALKSRVFLHMGRYADVVTEANKIVSATAPFASAIGVKHTLAPTASEVFKTPYTHVERIFSFPFTDLDLPGTQNGLGSYYNPGPRGIGDYSMNPNGLIKDSVNWVKEDERRTFIFKNTNNKFYWNKFATGPQHLDYVPVIRYTEVLLNLAEAKARTAGNDAQALALLNAVRTRAKGPAYSSFATANDLIEAILVERQIEFLGEGFRGIDQQRLLRSLPGKANVSAIAAASPAYLWPIPAGELLVNKKCTQNPGY
ncbi:MAG: RagB/SusD family nutrient uptake outer membrane protein [Saprospiraceae bacterium]|nr:RagB/SusD family nutrient uptake outer membrane protein [Saprospiraceae bacterium]